MTKLEVNSDIVNDNNTTTVVKQEKYSDETGYETEQSDTDWDEKYSEKSENSLVFWWIGEVSE